ncbi:MAG: hypothetical protein ACK441_06910, partial [Burkholderiales bacterium]
MPEHQLLIPMDEWVQGLTYSSSSPKHQPPGAPIRPATQDRLMTIDFSRFYRYEELSSLLQALVSEHPD